MKKVFLAALVIGAASAISGCGMLGGVGQCKFAKGEVAADLSADAKAFVEAAAEVRKIQLDWETEPEIKCALETILGVQADVKLKVDFSVSASAAVSGKA
ncbi:MAG: hypothetical protein WCI05_16580 [Myxococcales bacterium]